MYAKAKIVVGILCLAFGTLLIFQGTLFPKQLQPSALPLHFKQYQDGAGLKAVFEMENKADLPVVVWESASLTAHRDGRQEEQKIVIQRTIIPKGGSGILEVPVPKDCAWQAAFRVARFGPKQQQKFEAGQVLEGTVVFSDLVPKYESKP
jgi:hypothetical protein